MKLWPTIIENKYFVKMLWHLLGKCVKVIVLLVCSICTVHHFFFIFYFFPIIDLCSFFYSIFARFIQRFSLFIYGSILVNHFIFSFFLNSSYSTKLHCSYNSFFFFSLLFVLFFSFYIYHRTSSVFALWAHYSCNSASFYLFFFSNQFVFFFFSF